MGFQEVTAFADQFKRVTVCMYGAVRIGKTERLLRLAAAGEYVYIVSADKGFADAVRHPEKYAGHLLVSASDRIGDVRNDIVNLGERIKAKVRGGAPVHNRWICVDTATQMQTNFLTEGRRVRVSGTFNPSVNTDIVRDAVTQTDWGINLAWMSEIITVLMGIPANIVFVCLEDTDKLTGVPTAALSGQTRRHLMGTCDVILRMVRDEGGKRVFVTNQGSDGDAGCRGDVLESKEPADLALIRDKFLGLQTPTKETK